MPADRGRIAAAKRVVEENRGRLPGRGSDIGASRASVVLARRPLGQDRAGCRLEGKGHRPVQSRCSGYRSALLCGVVDCLILDASGAASGRYEGAIH